MVVKSKRLFIAIKVHLDADSLDAYNRLVSHLSFSNIRWVDSDMLHLTLKFIGNTPQDDIPLIVQAIKISTSDISRFAIEINKIGIFGSSYKPKVIWLGIVENNQLMQIANNLMSKLEVFGVVNDRQNFVPHITIGRINSVVDKKLFNAKLENERNAFCQKVNVNSVILYESEFVNRTVQHNQVYSCHLSD